jgi:hypothetical protein
MRQSAWARSIRIAALAAIGLLAAHGAEASETEEAIAPSGAWRTIQFEAPAEPASDRRLTIDWTRTPGQLESASRSRVRTVVREMPAPHGRRSRARKIVRMIVGGVAGSVVGFYSGALVGAAISGDCNGCDDPYFPGVVIGPFIGCPVGAVAGALLAR